MGTGIACGLPKYGNGDSVAAVRISGDIDGRRVAGGTWQTLLCRHVSYRSGPCLIAGTTWALEIRSQLGGVGHPHLRDDLVGRHRRIGTQLGVARQLGCRTLQRNHADNAH